MKLKVDHKADALYLNLHDEPVVDSEDISPGIIVDYGSAGQVVGIEMLYLSKRSPGAHTKKLLFETVPVLGGRI